MAQNTTVTLVADTWTQLTNANATAITFQNQSKNYIMVKGTTDTTTPTTEAGAIRYNPGQGERNVVLSDLLPGMAAVRLWAYCREIGSVLVSHV